MSIAEWPIDATTADAPLSPSPSDSTSRPLHRIAEIRHQQGVSLRTAARRMRMSMQRAREQEQAECDLSLSDLYRWQRALDVPVVDLLVDLDAPLSAPVLQRAQLLKLMKTALAIKEAAEDDSVALMADMLASQLVEIMPELRGVNAWHTVGQRRTLDEMGRTGIETVSDNVFFEARP